MLSKPQCITNVRDALLETSHTGTSLVCELPAPIVPGHPVHNGVVRLQRYYPNGMLPAQGRVRWKRLLRLSRSGNIEVLEAVDDFISWLTDEAKRGDAAVQLDDRQEDGLIQLGYRLRWRGREYELAPQTWRLLQFAGDEDAVSEGDLEDAVWGDEDVATSSIKQAVRRANRVLEKAGVPWRLQRRVGQIRKSASDSGDGMVTKLITLQSR